MITLNLLWHLHQPDYRHPRLREAVLPWVRLHAVKGYRDLLAVFERYPQARCAVNFSGILLDQLGDLCAGSLDSYAALSMKPGGELSPSEQQFALRNFFSGNRRTLIRPHPRYYELLVKKESLVRLEGLEGAAERFTAQELTDLAVWFNLAWIGFAGGQRKDVRELIAQGRDFGPEHQRQVLDIHRELAAEVLPGYRSLADAGQIELTFTPFHHPILPLLIDLAVLGYDNKDDPLPTFSHPEDAAEQVQRGMLAYSRAFGRAPRGAWPAEGSVSDAALEVLANAGLEWAATDQQNLPSREAQQLPHVSPWRWRRGSSSLAVFFRDTRLSDNIGFEYATWNPARAANHLVDMAIALATQSLWLEPVVTIALDGENPWEAFPDGGESFLARLFERVAAEQRLHCEVPSAILAQRNVPEISHVSPGSWIGGNFNIWSRHPETRLAWRRLARARRELVDVCRGSVQDHLLAAEGSDWFWWFGDDFETEESEQFDELFRAHLIAAYEAAAHPVPDEMYVPICTERRPKVVGEVYALMQPVVNGRVDTFFEWRAAVRVLANHDQSSMARASAATAITALWYGFSDAALCLRIDLAGDWLDELRSGGGKLVVTLAQDGTEWTKQFEIPSPGSGPAQDVALDEIIELCIGLAEAKLARDALAYLAVELATTSGRSARFPLTGRLALRIIAQDFASRNWFV